jgi:hypothetical protein
MGKKLEELFSYIEIALEKGDDLVEVKEAIRRYGELKYMQGGVDALEYND